MLYFVLNVFSLGSIISYRLNDMFRNFFKSIPENLLVLIKETLNKIYYSFVNKPFSYGSGGNICIAS